MGALLTRVRLGLFDRVQVALAVPYGVVYCLISIGNHLSFRTYAHDLGLFTHAVYNHSYLRLLQPATLHHIKQPKLADHFDPTTVLLGPLTWLWGSYTLLIVQILAVVVGGIGMGRFVRAWSNDNRLGWFAQALFYSTWGVFSALAFDFHSVVLGAMLLPWLLLAFQRRRWKAYWVLALLVLGCNETIALWMISVATGLAWLYRSDTRARGQALALAGVACVYFVLTLKVIIPLLQPEGVSGFGYTEKYAALGGSISEILKTIALHPQRAFTYLFENLPGVEAPVGVKSEVYWFLLLSGGVALLRRPVFVWMLLPILAQKMYYNHFTRWSSDYHYNIEFVPILAWAAAVWVAELQGSRTRQQIVRWALWLGACGTTLYALQHRANPWFNPVQSDFFTAPHYRPPEGIDRRAVHRGLALIPRSASVSASNTLAPHLALRREIYLYPELGTAAYVALLKDGNPYPMTHEEFNQRLAALQTDTLWTARYAAGGLFLFERRAP